MINSVGFTGTQKGMTEEQYREVSILIDKFAPKHVHHGDCVGADAEFHDIAKFIKGLYGTYPLVHTHPPSDPKKRAFCVGDVNYTPAPYLKRNRNIVAMSDALIATPKNENQNKIGSGTWTTVDYARQRGIPIYIVFPDGSVVFESGNAVGASVPSDPGLTSS